MKGYPSYRNLFAQVAIVKAEATTRARQHRPSPHTHTHPHPQLNP